MLLSALTRQRLDDYGRLQTTKVMMTSWMRFGGLKSIFPVTPPTAQASTLLDIDILYLEICFLY